VIIDVKRFADVEQPYWTELQAILDKIENDPNVRLSLPEVQRLHYLYERASAGLGKLMTFAMAPDIRSYLETLVARAYAEVHETRQRSVGSAFVKWFLQVFPQTFRKHFKAFIVSCAVMFVGCVIGAILLEAFPEQKSALLPFAHLHGSPTERVEREQAKPGRIAGSETEFSATLMTHNTRVSILTLSLGMTYGVGTIISLFYNGIILGAVSWDYVTDGQTLFLLGWLLPHG
jgi:hypothetical protein